MSEDPELISAYRPCVGIMVLNPDGLVWLGRRLDAPAEPEGPGSWWQMPQGGIDANEDPPKAALRELEEETGIRSVEIMTESSGWYTYDLPAELRPKAWGGRYRGQRQKWFAMRFTGSDDEIALERPGHPQEFDAWRWARLEELEGLIVPFKRSVYAQVVRDFAAFARPHRGA
ncbi:MAG TPA: RNA pyrophosphohydrolase [Hyphomicrobiaceae bacterium]|jgi:putative (di)nucleoside polyphosphate hydrolase